MENNYKINLERTANVPVTEGIHTFEIVSGEEGEGAKGAYWKFTLSCLDPDEEGKNTSLILSLSPQSRWRLELFLDAVHAPTKGFATADKFIGRRLRGKVVHEEYEGRVQPRVTELFPAVTTVSKPLSPSIKPVIAPNPVAKSAVRPLPLDVVGSNVDGETLDFGEDEDEDENENEEI